MDTGGFVSNKFLMFLMFLINRFNLLYKFSRHFKKKCINIFYLSKYSIPSSFLKNIQQKFKYLLRINVYIFKFYLLNILFLSVFVRHSSIYFPQKEVFLLECRDKTDFIINVPGSCIVLLLSHDNSTENSL